MVWIIHEFLVFFHLVDEPCVFTIRLNCCTYIVFFYGYIYLGISFKEPTGLDRGHSLFPRFITTIFLLTRLKITFSDGPRGQFVPVRYRLKRFKHEFSRQKIHMPFLFICKIMNNCNVTQSDLNIHKIMNNCNVTQSDLNIQKIRFPTTTILSLLETIFFFRYEQLQCIAKRFEHSEN